MNEYLSCQWGLSSLHVGDIAWSAQERLGVSHSILKYITPFLGYFAVIIDLCTPHHEDPNTCSTLLMMTYPYFFADYFSWSASTKSMNLNGKIHVPTLHIVVLEALWDVCLIPSSSGSMYRSLEAQWGCCVAHRPHVYSTVPIRSGRWANNYGTASYGVIVVHLV